MSRATRFLSVATATAVAFGVATAPQASAASLSEANDLGQCTLSFSDSEGKAFASYKNSTDFVLAQSMLTVFPTVEATFIDALSQKAVADYYKASATGRTTGMERARDNAIKPFATKAAERGVPAALFTDAVKEAASAQYSTAGTKSLTIDANSAAPLSNPLRDSELRSDYPALTATQVTALVEAGSTHTDEANRKGFDFEQDMNSAVLACSAGTADTVSFPTTKVASPFKVKNAPAPGADNTVGNSTGIIAVLAAIFAVITAIWMIFPTSTFELKLPF